MRLTSLQRACVASFCAATCWSAASLAGSGYRVPPIEGHVTDPAHRLSSDEKRAMEDKLEAYRDCSKHELAVFLAASLDGHTVEDVAYDTFNAWKIGRAHEDDGALLVIAHGERRTRIETGKGIGGSLPDLRAKAILSEHVSPHLKQNEFFQAVDEGTTEMANALGGCPVQSARTFM
ncbi:MAG: TPM domain-containing protein, partial [Polyangiaceae bacterium]|nr:TPM domain-containing protein [Polyangiaceae bacterium]